MNGNHPLLQAFKAEVLGAVEQRLASTMSGAADEMERRLMNVCRTFLPTAANQVANGPARPMLAASTSTPSAPCCDACASGNPCGCGPQAAACPAKPKPIPVTAQPCPGAPPMQVLPQCYTKCDCLDPCLASFYEEARYDFDEWSWLELNKDESEIVHLNRIAGAGPAYQVALPLAATQNILYGTEAGQQLPYQPGWMKIDFKWTNTPAPGAVTVNFYSGPRGSTGITNVQTAGLIQIARSFTLADFECKDDCYLLRWPKLFRCDTSAIPHRREVYVELRVGAVGASELTDLNVTLIKKGTDKWVKTCRQCGIDPY